jgi:hypothetical protein
LRTVQIDGAFIRCQRKIEKTEGNEGIRYLELITLITEIVMKREASNPLTSEYKIGYWNSPEGLGQRKRNSGIYKNAPEMNQRGTRILQTGSNNGGIRIMSLSKPLTSPNAS